MLNGLLKTKAVPVRIDNVELPHSVGRVGRWLSRDAPRDQESMSFIHIGALEIQRRVLVSQDARRIMERAAVLVNGRPAAHRKRTGALLDLQLARVQLPGAAPGLIEANFLGLDPRIRDASETYVLEDPDLPLMVFGPLGLLRPGPVVELEGLRVPLPRSADLMAEKLLTDRTDEKGARDLLVVAGMLIAATPADSDELVRIAVGLSAESRHAICSALTVLSLMEGRAGMPDPAPVREMVTYLLSRIEVIS